jgi:signal transduction histidine kinase
LADADDKLKGSAQAEGGQNGAERAERGQSVSARPEIKKEAVDETLKELEAEKKRRAAAKPKKPLLTVLFWLFFYVTLPAVFISRLAKRVKIPISVKMLVIYALVFGVIISAFTVFFISSVAGHLEPGVRTDEYLKALKITAGLLAAVFGIVFTALVAVVSTLMLNPIRKITDKIDDITTEDLSQRLEIIDTQDELMELTDRINEMLDNIEESFARQQNFVSDASHELKTPIAVIQGYANLLRRWGAEKPDILNEAIEAIRRESDNMRRIVDQLLLLARLGKMSMNKTVFNLCEVVGETVSDYGVMSGGHKLTFSGPPEILVETDKNLLLESVRTLVDNAIKYTPEGGEISVDCNLITDGERRVTVSVTDTGIGISKEDLPKVFDRFFRCDRARGRETGGSGLGLTIAKSIVEMMGGKIGAESSVGNGSTFTITLY